MPTYWIGSAVGSVVFLGFVYLIARYQVGHEAAVKGLPIVGAILVGVIAIGIVFRALPNGWGDKAWIAFFWLLPLVLIWLLLTRGKRQRQAGAVLMDLGRGRALKTQGFVAVLAFLLALPYFVEIMSESGETARLLAEGTFYLSLGGYLLLMWYEGRQLREGGIVSYGSLHRWDKIQRYDWNGEILSLSLNRRWPFSRIPVPLRISSDQWEAVDQILRERLQTEQ